MDNGIMTSHPTASSVAETLPQESMAGRRGVQGHAIPLARSVARSPATWLVVLVGLSTLVWGAVGARVASPWILPDELVYSDLAKSIASGTFPSVRGVHQLGWGVVYQALIAPAWFVFEDPARAYRAVLAINAFVMSLAAVPAYFLARMFLGRRPSVLVAAMTVLVPSMSYTGVVMTENACYPAFLLAVLFIARSVRSPSIANQALALLGLGVVALTRIQAIALVAAYFVAVVMYAWSEPRAERAGYLRRLIPTAVVSALVSFAPMTASIARGHGVFGWLGSRSATFDEFHVHEVPQWFAFLVADLVLYVAVAPVAATAIVLGRSLSRSASAPMRLFAAVALPTILATLVSVSLVSASIDVDGTENLNERYVFYVVPILFIGLALWIREGLPRPHPWAWVTVGVCCLLPALLPIGLLGYNAGFQSPALLPWLRIHASYSVVAMLVAAFTLACGTLWIACRRNRVGYLWVVTGLCMVAVGAITVISNSPSSSNTAWAFHGRPANWVDRTIPDGARVAVVWRRGPETLALPVEFSLMVTEFFNRSIDDVYRIGRPTYYEGFLPTVPVRATSTGALTDATGGRIAPRYVLVTCRTPVVGRIVARAPDDAFRLVEVAPPLRLRPPGRCGY